MKIACKAILSDLDGTLYDSSLVSREALRTCGFDRESRAYLEARALVKRRLGMGHVSARNRILYFMALLECSGSYSPAAVLDKIHVKSCFFNLAILKRTIKRSAVMVLGRRLYRHALTRKLLRKEIPAWDRSIKVFKAERVSVIVREIGNSTGTRGRVACRSADERDYPWHYAPAGRSIVIEPA